MAGRGNSWEFIPADGRIFGMEVFTLTSVTLTFPEALSTASYEDLKDYFDLFLRKAKRRAGAGDELKKMMEDEVAN